MDIYGLDYNDNSDKQVWSYVYLHGQLEDMNGYDLCYTNDKKPVENTRKHVVAHIKGKAIPATLFFWYEDRIAKGLVVADDDNEGFSEALKHWLKFNPKYYQY